MTSISVAEFIEKNELNTQFSGVASILRDLEAKDTLTGQEFRITGLAGDFTKTSSIMVKKGSEDKLAAHVQIDEDAALNRMNAVNNLGCKKE